MLVILQCLRFLEQSLFVTTDKTQPLVNVNVARPPTRDQKMPFSQIVRKAFQSKSHLKNLFTNNVGRPDHNTGTKSSTLIEQ